LDMVQSQPFAPLEVDMLLKHKSSQLICPCSHLISKSWADPLWLWSWFNQDLPFDKLTFQASIVQISKVLVIS